MAAPQFPQNFFPSPTSAWQFGQVIAHLQTNPITTTIAINQRTAEKTNSGR
jgi:hypothetical protein